MISQEDQYKQLRVCYFQLTGIGSEHPEAKVGPVIGRERQLRDRNDQMRVPGKSFSDVLPIIEISRNQQRQSKERAKAKAKAMPTPAKVRSWLLPQKHYI